MKRVFVPSRLSGSKRHAAVLSKEFILTRVCGGLQRVISKKTFL
jgi:hypothetical protein